VKKNKIENEEKSFLKKGNTPSHKMTLFYYEVHIEYILKLDSVFLI
jgi:hypothetical protein